MKVLVVTVVHHPQDARIRARQIECLLTRGVQISLAAPFEDFQVEELDPRVNPINLPRAEGTNRVLALRAATKLITHSSSEFDLVLIHDPELIFAARKSTVPVIWDVHEDTSAALSMKSWLPGIFKIPAKLLIRYLERYAEKKFTLILAESSYQNRFKKKKRIVPNTTLVKPLKNVADRSSVIYLGTISSARGGYELIELAKKLQSFDITVELIGLCGEPQLEVALIDLNNSATLRWYGFMPNVEALNLLQGAIAGLSLLHDQPNYQHSQPTKIFEYLAAGLPVITTNNPAAAQLVTKANCGFIVNFHEVDAVVEAVTKLRDDAQLRRTLGNNGYEYVLTNHSWDKDQEVFLSAIEDALAK
jgi:glycosyltransferase involved in cell wall biosynthesis